MATGAVVARILTQYSDKGSKTAQKDIAKLGKQFDAFAKKTAKAFGIAAAAVAAFAVKIGKDAVQAAIADQKSQMLLANSLRNTVGATDAAIASVEAYISKIEVQLGVVDDELRPALSKLAAVTGDVAAAQDLLGLALDISAFSGANLSSATTALTRGLQGNFRSLQKLVPSIDAASIKSKDFAAILAEVQKATQGSAATRAGTLEYKLGILRIRFNNILEELGYKLLPVLENFANVISSKVLPQIEAFIQANGTKLVAAFQVATDGALKLLGAAISFSNWITNNMGLIKTTAGLIAAMFAVGKVAAFASVIGKLTAAFVALRTSAGLAAVATAYATGGASVASATAALALIGGAAAITGGVVALKRAGNEVRAQKASENAARLNQQNTYLEFLNSRAKKSNTVNGAVDAGFNFDTILAKLLAGQNKLNNAKTKELTIEQKLINAILKKYKLGKLMTAEAEVIATAKAIELNLARQGKIAKNAPTVSLAAQGDGSASGTSSIMNSGAPQVTVNITTPFGTEDDYTVKVQNDLGTLARRRGGRTASGFNTGIYAE
jgi:hypothetical protein